MCYNITRRLGKVFYIWGNRMNTKRIFFKLIILVCMMHATTPVFAAKEKVDTCGICLEELDKVTLKCSHTFHSKCILKWADTDGAQETCPICRALHKIPRGATVVPLKATFAEPKITLLVPSNLETIEESFFKEIFEIYNREFRPSIYTDPTNAPQQFQDMVPCLLLGNNDDFKHLLRNFHGYESEYFEKRRPWYNSFMSTAGVGVIAYIFTFFFAHNLYQQFGYYAISFIGAAICIEEIEKKSYFKITRFLAETEDFKERIVDIFGAQENWILVFIPKEKINTELEMEQWQNEMKKREITVQFVTTSP